MGPFLPNCRFKGFFILVHASLKMHLFFKALYYILDELGNSFFSFSDFVFKTKNKLFCHFLNLNAFLFTVKKCQE